jgi:hypothetical protein
MSANKEAVMSEKEAVAGFGCTVVTSYSPVIQSADFPTFEGFMAKLQEMWDAEWVATMSADAAGGRAGGRRARRWWWCAVAGRRLAGVPSVCERSHRPPASRLGPT